MIAPDIAARIAARLQLRSALIALRSVLDASSPEDCSESEWKSLEKGARLLRSCLSQNCERRSEQGRG